MRGAVVIAGLVGCLAIGGVAAAAAGDAWTASHGLFADSATQNFDGTADLSTGSITFTLHNDSRSAPEYTLTAKGHFYGRPMNTGEQNLFVFTATGATLRNAGTGTTVCKGGRINLGGSYAVQSYGAMLFPNCSVFKGTQYFAAVVNQPVDSSIDVTMTQR